MFSWQLVLLLSCLAMLATCLPMVHEVHTPPHNPAKSNPSIPPDPWPQETASSSPSRPAPHHSLATMLYSLLVQVGSLHPDGPLTLTLRQEEAEDADISALP